MVLGKCFIRFNFIAILIFLMSFFSQRVNGQSYFAASDDLKAKYSKKLGLPVDSLCCYNLLTVIEQWTEFVKKHPEKIKTNPEGVFVQFIYYLAYSTKIPSAISNLYSDKKTYLFRNNIYLQPGDLVFYSPSSDKMENVTLALQNKILVFPGADGTLNFTDFNSFIGNHKVVYAKIMKDEKN